MFKPLVVVLILAVLSLGLIFAALDNNTGAYAFFAVLTVAYCVVLIIKIFKLLGNKTND